jgi:hypothetical protein
VDVDGVRSHSLEHATGNITSKNKYKTNKQNKKQKTKQKQTNKQKTTHTKNKIK